MRFTVLLFLGSAALASQFNLDSLHPGEPTRSNETCSLVKAFSVQNRHEVCFLTPDSVATKPAIPLPVIESFKAEHWTETPACIQAYNESSNTFCVCTNSTFAGGRGISMFTTHPIAEHIARQAAFTDAKALEGINAVSSSPPYTVQSLTGRGVGLIMNRTLHRGDTIFSHTPVLIVHRATFEALNETDRLRFQHEALNHLPEASRDLVLALHGHFGGDHVDDVIHTNSFQVYLGENDEPHNILLLETSRMNHDCRPNAHYYFDVKTLTHYVHALRTIHIGEELTISYIDGRMQRRERQERIKLSWGFDCSCSLCSQREVFTRESDKRLQLISSLDEQLDEWYKESAASPEAAETLIWLYEQERLHACISTAYTLAALAYNAVRREHTALKYAALTVEFGILNSGPDDLDVQAMQAFMENPKAHWSWGRRVSETHIEQCATCA